MPDSPPKHHMKTEKNFRRTIFSKCPLVIDPGNVQANQGVIEALPMIQMGEHLNFYHFYCYSS